MTASNSTADGSKELPARPDRGPNRGELRLEIERFEVEDNEWAVQPNPGTDPPEFIWLELIGNIGEWSATFTPSRARELAAALERAAAEVEDA